MRDCGRLALLLMMALLVLSGPPLLIGCISVCSGGEVLVGFYRYTYYFADIRSEVVMAWM